MRSIARIISGEPNSLKAHTSHASNQRKIKDVFPNHIRMLRIVMLNPPSSLSPRAEAGMRRGDEIDPPHRQNPIKNAF